MAEYAQSYGGLPPRSDPWPMFLALLERCPRFDARARVQLVDSVAAAIGSAFGDGVSLERDEMLRAAYPLNRTGPAMALIQSGQ